MTTNNRWVYLTDLAPNATIKNLQTGETRTIMSNAVKDRAPSGLRRTVLLEQPGGMFQETDEVLPLTVDLAEEIEEYYTTPNSWNYDWPHLPTEVDDTPEARARLEQLILQQMGEVPFTFKITGMQRRFLMYFSDGSWESQKRYERLIPRPGQTPFNRSWDLKPRYDLYYNSIMRDAKVPIPKEKVARWGTLAPCLYIGPAWTLRFQIDGQDPLLERCRVYVMDDGTFIGSDWCQRHDFSSYQNGGINLQMGIYTLSSWIMGPCLTYNQGHGGVKLKSTTYKVEKVRELMKKPSAVSVPKFEDTYTNAKKLIDQYLPKPAAPATPVADVGPITADVIKEADAAYQKALEQILVKRAGLTAPDDAARATDGVVPAAVAPAKPPLMTSHPRYLATINDFALFRVDLSPEYPLEQVVGFHRATDGVVSCRVLGASDSFDLATADAYLDLDDAERFAFASPGYPCSSGFWYLGLANDDLGMGDDPLATGWWLYHAACFYRDEIATRLEANPVMQTLLETT